PDGFRVDSFSLTSNKNGELQMAADVPIDAPISAFLQLDQFPAGELAAFALGGEGFSGVLSGRADLSGILPYPTLIADFRADSLGTTAVQLSDLRVQAEYAAQQLNASVSLTDTVGRAVRGTLRLPADLRLQSVIGERIYTEEL